MITGTWLRHNFFCISKVFTIVDDFILALQSTTARFSVFCTRIQTIKHRPYSTLSKRKYSEEMLCLSAEVLLEVVHYTFCSVLTFISVTHFTSTPILRAFWFSLSTWNFCKNQLMTCTLSTSQGKRKKKRIFSTQQSHYCEYGSARNQRPQRLLHHHTSQALKGKTKEMLIHYLINPSPAQFHVYLADKRQFKQQAALRLHQMEKWIWVRLPIFKYSYPCRTKRRTINKQFSLLTNFLTK